MPNANNNFLVASLAAISVTDSVKGSQTLKADITPGVVRIDSAVPQIWLPEQACRVFETTFGLTWDDSLKLYLISDTIYERLARDKPEVIFTLTDGARSINYTLP
jgi:hypothetical protein